MAIFALCTKVSTYKKVGVNVVDSCGLPDLVYLFY